MYQSSTTIEHQEAVQCALIAVKEIRGRDLINGDWWDKVKQEIENL